MNTQHVPVTKQGVVVEALEGVDGVVRLAAIASVGLAEAAAARGIGRLMYASSAAGYGAIELYLDVFRRCGALDPRPLRCFNVDGPRQDPSSRSSGAIGIFANRLVVRRPLTVYGDGLQARDDVSVGDVVHVT